VPKALVDTSVLLAVCYGRRAWQSPLLTAWLGGHFDWVISEDLLAERNVHVVAPFDFFTSLR